MNNKMNYQILYLVLMISLLSTSLTYGRNIEDSNGFQYTYNEGSDNEVTLYSGKNETVVTIPESFIDRYSTTPTYKVVAIGQNSFNYCIQVSTVHLPMSCRTIGENAFLSCISLSHFYIQPGNVKDHQLSVIGNNAFKGCENLLDFSLPNSITVIGSYAFDGCKSLTSVTIPANLESIGIGAFSGCVSLNSVTSLAETPIAINTNTFEEEVYEKAVLNVPQGCVSKYRNKSGWSRFKTITDGQITDVDYVEIMVNDAHMEYRGSFPNLTYTVTAGEMRGGKPTLSCSASRMSSPGTYEIVAEKGTLSNHYVKLTNGKLYIEKAPLAISAINYERGYGEDNPKFEAQYVGFKDGQDEWTLTTRPILSCVANANSLPGDYVIAVEGATSSCYDITQYAGILTIKDGLPPLQTNKLSIDNGECYTDDTVNLPVVLKNQNEITAIQFDLVIPEGFIIPNNSTEDNISLAPRAVETAHKCELNLLNENMLRVVAYSPEMSAFVGNDGSVLNITLSTTDKIGSHNIELKNIVLCTTDSRTIYSSSLISNIIVKQKPIPDTDVTQYENVVFANNVEGAVGGQVNLSLEMNNTVEATGFQVDLYLPEGVTVHKDDDGEYDVKLSTARTTEKKMNIFSCAQQQDGALRILCSSTGSYTFSGNSGEVATITLNIDETVEEGELPIILKNIVISDKDSYTYEVDYVKSTLKVLAYTLGDVNNDKKVNVGDITGTANHILGNTPANFVTKAADVNMDEKINVGDITGIANLILYNAVNPSAKIAAKAPRRVSYQEDENNTITVDDVTVTQGGRHSLAVNLINRVEACGLQFDLYLPEGVIIPQDEDGFYLMSLSDRTTDKKTNIFDCAKQQDGAYRILLGSTSSSAFTGNEGVICNITIEADADAPLSTQEVEVKEIVISATSSDTYETSLVTFNLTIGEPADLRTVLDETSTTAPEDATGVDVRVKRTINANEWSTIVLPFAMTAEQVKAAFGNDVQLADFTGCDTETDDDENVTSINVKFDAITAIEANHPYIIKVSNNITEFTADGVDIEVEEEPSVDCDRIGKGTKKDPYLYNSFVGTYVADTEVPENALFLSENKFWYSTGASKMKAFRAYFDFYDVLTEVENAGAKIGFYIDETTGITSFNNLTISPSGNGANSPIYNVFGQRVGKSYKGVVVVKGRKYVKK